MKYIYYFVLVKIWLCDFGVYSYLNIDLICMCFLATSMYCFLFKLYKFVVQLGFLLSIFLLLGHVCVKEDLLVPSVAADGFLMALGTHCSLCLICYIC